MTSDSLVTCHWVPSCIEMILGGGKGSNFNFVDFEKIFGQKWAPRISNRAHISQNLSGQKIVQFSEMTPPLHGRSPKMQISHFLVSLK